MSRPDPVLFDKLIKNLNAHLWLPLTLAEHTKGTFAAMGLEPQFRHSCSRQLFDATPFKLSWRHI